MTFPKGERVSDVGGGMPCRLCGRVVRSLRRHSQDCPKRPKKPGKCWDATELVHPIDCDCTRCQPTQQQAVSELIEVCLDFFYGEGWTPDLFAKCEPVLTARIAPILARLQPEESAQ